MNFFTTLGVVLIVLKLLGVTAVASWPWLLVLLPIYAPLVLVAVFMAAVMVVKAASY